MGGEPTAVEVIARVDAYIEHYEDAPNWGGPTMYPAPLSIADIKALRKFSTPPADAEEVREVELRALALRLAAAHDAQSGSPTKAVTAINAGVDMCATYWENIARAALTAIRALAPSGEG